MEYGAAVQLRWVMRDMGFRYVSVQGKNLHGLGYGYMVILQDDGYCVSKPGA